MFEFIPPEKQDPTHLKWMREALRMAEEAMEAREVPVGCVFVRNGAAIAWARNRTNELRNATRHAELEAIDEIFANPSLTPVPIPALPLSQTDLATYFGAANERFGGCGSVLDVNHRETLTQPQYPASFGYLREECIMILRRFYITENSNAPAPKTKARRILKTHIADPNETKRPSSRSEN